jgi:hypothetical protein
MSKLLLNEQVESVINSYPGDNLDIIDRLFKGKIRLEVLPQVIKNNSNCHHRVMPHCLAKLIVWMEQSDQVIIFFDLQGTLIEKIRAGGAGVPGKRLTDTACRILRCPDSFDSLGLGCFQPSTPPPVSAPKSKRGRPQSDTTPTARSQSTTSRGN